MDINLLCGFFIAVFSVLNPIGNLPIFIDITAPLRPGVRVAMSVLISAVICLALIVFLFTGQAILSFFGISLPAFQIAGGIVLLLMGLGMTAGKAHGLGKKLSAGTAKGGLISDFQEAEAGLKDVIVPIAFPLFVGPGSLSTVVLYAAKAQGHWDTLLGLAGTLLLVSALTGVILALSNSIARLLGHNGLQIATRILGLFIVAIGVQFILKGLAAVTTLFDVSAING
jgi:MarC family membrane protein